MANLSLVVRQLQSERDRARGEVERLDAAITALSGVGRGSSRRKVSATNNVRRRRRKISAAGRRRIAAVQRARWAKLKAQQKQGKKAA